MAKGLFSRDAIVVAGKAFERNKSLELQRLCALTDLSESDIHINNRPWLDRVLRTLAPKRAKGNYRFTIPRRVHVPGG